MSILTTRLQNEMRKLYLEIESQGVEAALTRMDEIVLKKTIAAMIDNEMIRFPVLIETDPKVNLIEQGYKVFSGLSVTDLIVRGLQSVLKAENKAKEESEDKTETIKERIEKEIESFIFSLATKPQEWFSDHVDEIRFKTKDVRVLLSDKELLDKLENIIQDTKVESILDFLYGHFSVIDSGSYVFTFDEESKKDKESYSKYCEEEEDFSFPSEIIQEMEQEFEDRKAEIATLGALVAEYFQQELVDKRQIIEVCRNQQNCDDVKLLMLCGQSYPLQFLYTGYLHQSQPLEDFVNYMIAQ